MSIQPLVTDDPRIDAALDELRALVRQRYPDATFAVTPSPDDPSIVHLVTEVDLDDTEELVDLVIDRMIELQVDEGLPIYVIPQRRWIVSVPSPIGPHDEN